MLWILKGNFPHYSTLRKEKIYFTLQEVRLVQFSANVWLHSDASCLCSIHSRGKVGLLFSFISPSDVALWSSHIWPMCSTVWPFRLTLWWEVQDRHAPALYFLRWSSWYIISVVECSVQNLSVQDVEEKNCFKKFFNLAPECIFGFVINLSWFLPPPSKHFLIFRLGLLIFRFPSLPQNNYNTRYTSCIFTQKAAGYLLLVHKGNYVIKTLKKLKLKVINKCWLKKI